MFVVGGSYDGLGLPDDAEFGPDALVAALADLPPGPALHGLLALLEPAHLGEAQVIEVGAAWERQRRHDAAWELALLARMESLPVDVPDDLEPRDDYRSGSMGPMEWAAVARGERCDAYALATAQPAVTISNKARAALLLAPDGTLSATGAALAAGRISETRAHAIADKLGELPADQAAAIEAKALPTADLVSCSRLRRDLDTQVMAARAATERERHREARATRHVSRPQPMPYGMAKLEVHGPAEDVALLHTALTGIAEMTKGAAVASAKAAGDPAGVNPSAGLAEVEGIDAHRFDALITLAAGALSDGALPTRHGRRPAIAITVALSTLLGLDEHPAQLAGYGPITAGAARRAADDPTGTMQRLITRPDGLVIDAAYTSYRPPQALCDTVIARDGTCTYPGCGRPALLADLDHEIPWPGGETSYGNIGARCRRHHNQKTAKLITPRYDPDTGDTVWTDRRGRTARRLAVRHPQPPPRPAAQFAPPNPAQPHLPNELAHPAEQRTPPNPAEARGPASASASASVPAPPDDDPPPF